MNIFLRCISCGTRSRSDEASAPLVRQPYLRTQSLDPSFRRGRFRSAASDEWQPSLTAISEESSECSSCGDRTPQQQQSRFDVRSEMMKRSGNGMSRVRSDSIDCRCDSFTAIFAASAPAPFMF